MLPEANRIYDGVEAETRKSQASFQILESYARLAHYIHKTERPFNSKTFVQAITIYFKLLLTC